MKVTAKKATGVLAELIANIDDKELARTRKRMMLAAKVEDAIKRQGLNQVQFARLMGKSPTVISEWLSGDRNFTIDTLTDIEEALGIQLLNTSVMTAIQSGTASTYTIPRRRNAQAEAVMNIEVSWTLNTSVAQLELKHNYA